MGFEEFGKNKRKQKNAGLGSEFKRTSYEIKSEQ